MNLILHNPWGLLALLSIPAILWLHRYVVRGTVKPVSCLALWQDPETLSNEGQVKDKLPLTWVLLLELLAAVLLTLVIAGLDWQATTTQQPHVGIVIDNSASMAGQHAYTEVLQHLNQIQTHQSPLNVSVILSGTQPRLLGGQALPIAEAIAQLQQHQPNMPHHSLVPALELLSLLVPNPENSLIFSDNPEFQHPRKVSVGSPAPNIGIITADWQAGNAPFIVLRNFSATPTALTVQLTVDNSQQLLQIDDLAAHSEHLLELPVTAEATQITLGLPEDALAIDNQVTLFSPVSRQLSLWVRHDVPSIQTAFRKLANALPMLQTRQQLPVDILVLDRSIAVENSFVVALPDSAESPQFYANLVVNAFHPLLSGFETQGLVWYGYPFPLSAVSSTATLLLQSDTTPLLWATEQQLVFNLDWQRSNLFQHVSFPVLMQNLVQWRDAEQGGLLRRNYRVGETIQLQRAADWIDKLTLISPSGVIQTFAASTNPLPLPRFEETGIYALNTGTASEQFVVNFLDAREGDLTLRTSPSSARPALPVSQLATTEQDPRLQQFLLMLASLALLVGWLMLAFR